MKTHIGVDNQSKLTHLAVATSANAHNSMVIGYLLPEEQTSVWGDSAYTGKKSAIKATAPKARDFNQKNGSRHRKLTDQEVHHQVIQPPPRVLEQNQVDATRHTWRTTKKPR
ncbi:transposase [Porticoccus sp. W117]|uniref:transposase n=1 Tax=Porticoccus sp. W117 TaxID=3054777 RepID=UPI00338EF7E2